MFIKFGKKQHLNDFRNKGEMWFNPCQYFRELDQDDGISDPDDGGLNIEAIEARIIDQKGNSTLLNNISLRNVAEPTYKTPMFCLYQTDNKKIKHDDYSNIKKEFPDYTHALIIEDEIGFLENVRFSLRSKAFCHNVFYQDVFYVEYIRFLRSGRSDVNFYIPKRRDRYYAILKYQESVNDDSDFTTFYIDDTNVYKTMYSKKLKYKNQNEYRIVLPYEQIEKGQTFFIKPFDAELIEL